MSELDDEILYRSIYEQPHVLVPPSPVFRVSDNGLEESIAAKKEFEKSQKAAKQYVYRNRRKELHISLLKQKQALRYRSNQAYRLLRTVNSGILRERISLYLQMMEQAIHEITNALEKGCQDRTIVNSISLSTEERFREKCELVNVLLEDLQFVLSEDRGFNKTELRELVKDSRSMIEKNTDFQFNSKERDGQGVQRYMESMLHAHIQKECCLTCGQPYLMGLAYCLNCCEWRGRNES